MDVPEQGPEPDRRSGATRDVPHVRREHGLRAPFRVDEQSHRVRCVSPAGRQEPAQDEVASLHKTSTGRRTPCGALLPTLTFVGEMPCPVERLWAFHNSADALVRLSPPGQRVTVEGDLEVHDGAIQHLRIVRFGIPIHWIARIEGVRAPSETHPGGFVDVAERSPFAAWRHEHRMEATASGSRLTDTVTYTPPFGIFGRIADALFLRRDVERLFAHRHRATRAAIETPDEARR
ncbi:hypothetical protein EON77_06750 [bacterium]|nr:MAG: hypothetical protein EON77_06750 [bacterium]